MRSSNKAIQFLESLRIPKGPKAGREVKLALYFKQFVKADLATAIRGRA